MTQKQARSSVMAVTRQAMEQWDIIHKNDGKAGDFDAMMCYVNDCVLLALPEDVRKLAV